MTKTYFFTIKETDLHDQELDMIEAHNLEEARKVFASNHPEDVNNVTSICIEDEFMPIWQSEE